MIRALIACLTLLSAFQVTAADAKTVSCSYPKRQVLTFEVPRRSGGLPTIDFDYPARVVQFRLQGDRLRLVAMDETEKKRMRITISARRNRTTGIYSGRIVTDSGGNQVMLDRNPVTCSVKS